MYKYKHKTNKTNKQLRINRFSCRCQNINKNIKIIKKSYNRKPPTIFFNDDSYLKFLYI